MEITTVNNDQDLNKLAYAIYHDHCLPLSDLCTLTANKFTDLAVYDQLHSDAVSSLIADVREFLSLYSTVYMPYINELAQKKALGHDCSTCSGRCDAQHSLKLAELTSSVIGMQYRLAAQQEFPTGSLSVSMNAVHERLEVMLSIIHSVLLPKIKEIQAGINIRN